MSKRYLAVWSGGYEAPVYELFFTEEEAMKKARAWWDDSDKERDWIDVLEIDLITETIERIEHPTEDEDTLYENAR